MSFIVKNVYVTLTTISPRINKVHETIQSILNQTYPINKITLYLSKTPFLIDQGIQHIPKKLSNLMEIDQRFMIEYVENIGPYRKLIPALKEHWKEDCLIITIDDDKIYDENMISHMVNEFYSSGQKYVVANRAFLKVNRILRELCETKCGVPNEVLKLIINEIANKGTAQYLSYILSKEYDFIRIITFFEGNDGVLYHPKFFTPLVYDYKLINKLAQSHDDFWFKLCALSNGYGVTCVNSCDNRKSLQRENTQESALHFNINKGSYDKTLNNLVRWFDTHKLLDHGLDLMLEN